MYARSFGFTVSVAKSRVRGHQLIGRFSAVPATSNDETPSTNFRKPLRKTTGGLQKLPFVRPPREMINQARKTALKTRADTEIKNIRTRCRKHGAETLNEVSMKLCLPIRDTVKAYRYTWKNLHPFERVVADLTATAREKKDGLRLVDVLNDLNEARKEIMNLSKDWIVKIKSADNAKLANDFRREGVKSMINVYDDLVSPQLMNLISLQKALRRTPVVNLDAPAVVLVGSPNVGKSSIIRKLSSATPEVNNYPFTTRGVTIGHVQVFWDETGPGTSETYQESQQCQIMDSPGLLVRSDEERNEMEALTMAAMQHLPTAVCYVMDLTGFAGDKCSSIADQLELRQEVRARFPKRPWIDVVSKVDAGIAPGALEDLEDILRHPDGTMDPYILLSVLDDTGVNELKETMIQMLSQVRVVLAAMKALEIENLRKEQPINRLTE